MTYSHPQQGSAEEALKLRRKLGEILKGRRLELEMNQKDLADAVGFGYYTMVSQIESGRTRIPPERMMDYAKTLTMSPKEFGTMVLRHYDPFTFKMIFGKQK